MKNSREAMFEKLNSQLDQDKGGRPAKDPRYWEPTLDKTGAGFAVIRFLPAPGEEVVPYIRQFSYGFKGPKSGKWYVEVSPQTIGLPCPVQEYWSELWNADRKEEAKRFSRKTSYVSNIQVVTDPSNPENEGKVFLYRYGAKIMEKVEMKMKPQFAGDTPVNPFDMWAGCNLELRIITKDKSAANPRGFRNYDNSVWQAPSEVGGSDDEREAIWKQEHSIAEMIAPDKFESYDSLKAKFNVVMSLGTDTPDMGQSAPAAQPSQQIDPAATRKPTTAAAEPEATETPWVPDEAASIDMEEDPEIAEYRKLAGLS